MKRILFFCLIGIVLCSSVFANSQKYYAVSSQQWQSVNDLCHVAGVSGPSSFGPVSQAQLEIALDKAETRLGKDHPAVLRVRSLFEDGHRIYKDDFGNLALDAAISPEVYYQNKTEASKSPIDPDSEWGVKKYLDRKPCFSLKLENEILNSFYGKFVLPYIQKKQVEGRWNKAFTTNFTNKFLSHNFPYEAGISLGSKGLNMIIGRNRVSLGEGKTGNLAIGDVFDYQEFLKASFFTRNTGIHLQLTAFDSSHDVNIQEPYKVKGSSFSGWKQIRHTADFEVNATSNLKFSLGLLNLLDTDNAFDIRMLNPFMIFHNMFNYVEGNFEANNLLTLDFSYTFKPKWNLYGQFAMDQFQLGSEVEKNLNELGYTEPNAFGLLLNLSYSDFVGKGLFNAYGEVVVNGRCMYLNQKYYDDNGKVTQTNTGKRCWSQDWLLGYARTLEDGDSQMAFSGYGYGPDCVVVSAGAVYREIGRFDVSSSLFYMAHGEKGRGTDCSNYDFTGVTSKKDLFKLPLVDEKVEHTFVAKVEGNCYFTSWCSAYAGAAYVYKINKDFTGENDGRCQVAFGLTLKTDFNFRKGN